MTWEELRDLLVELSDETRVVSTQGLDTVALNLVPIAWFISMRFNNALNIGVYEGDEHRLVGTEQIPLPELTSELSGNGWSKQWRNRFAGCSIPMR